LFLELDQAIAWFVDESDSGSQGLFSSYTSFYGYMIDGPLGSLALSVVSFWFRLYLKSTIDIPAGLGLSKLSHLTEGSLVLYDKSYYVNSYDDYEYGYEDKMDTNAGVDGVRFSHMQYAKIQSLEKVESKGN
jgi:hypothetical protein